MMKRNLAISMSMPIVRLYQGVLALIPAKALPLFPAPLEYVYRISENPCAPAVIHIRSGRSGRIPVAVLSQTAPRN